MYRVRGQVFARTVKRLSFNLATASILDVGSGSGFYIDRWLRLGAKRIAGSDLTEIALKRLKARFPSVPCTQLDIAASPTQLAPATFDVISAMDVFFHITDDVAYDRALANTAELLRPGGLLLFSDNFLHGPAVRAEHQVSRSLTEIMSSLGRANLRVIERRPMFVLMNFPVDLGSHWLQYAWRGFGRMVSMNESIGFVAGALLWPIESLLVQGFAEGPSTELMVCRRENEPVQTMG
jgi:SAM-dependent methyltransferase